MPPVEITMAQSPMPIQQNVMTVATASTIPLDTLMDFIIQRTYHEISVLTELLPTKTDMERKIEIVQFASRTRQLFVRLLALTKWANSASKVDKCGEISNFLNDHCMYFVETADLLAKMSRETLVQARLPCFSLPAAIDVLTTGSYPRLPTCIKDKIIPAETISDQDKRETLMRLNQIIEHRLVTADLPKHMRRLSIQQGRVKFLVEHEFSVYLTLMGDSLSLPFTLLSIEFHVEDPETGDCRPLVHPLQAQYVKDLVQSRLKDNDRPLHDLFETLHAFCQSLQLEVLHSQALRLIQRRLGTYIHIEEYVAGEKLTVTYWRHQAKSPNGQIYKMCIHVDEHEPSKPLQITHFPPIKGSESVKVVQAIRNDYLSLEKLLVHTVQVRAVAKLKDIEREFRLLIPGPCELKDVPSVLYVPVLYPCQHREHLSIAIHPNKGTFMVSVNRQVTSLTTDIEECLNGEKQSLFVLLSKFRLWLALQRVSYSACQATQRQPLEQLPLLNLTNHALSKLSPSRMFIPIPHYSRSYLVVSVTETPLRQVQYAYHLLLVEPAPCEHRLSSENEADLRRMYLSPGPLLQLDEWVCTRGVHSDLYDTEIELDASSRKRKLYLGLSSEIDKRPHAAHPYISAVPHILNMLGYRLPLTDLADQLSAQGLHHQGVESEAEGVGFRLRMVESPPCAGMTKGEQALIRRSCLSITFRFSSTAAMRTVQTEFVFTPLNIEADAQACVHRRVSTYPWSGSTPAAGAAKSFLADWLCIAKLYLLVYNLKSTVKHFRKEVVDLTFANCVKIHHYSLNKLYMHYGANKSFIYLAVIRTNAPEKKVELTFGILKDTPVQNPHSVAAKFFSEELNRTGSLVHIITTLIETIRPYSSLAKLSRENMFGTANKAYQVAPRFAVVCQSTTTALIMFRRSYCIKIRMRGRGMVTMRDGALSTASEKSMEGLTPIPHFKAFLNKYVDSSAAAGAHRRQSVADRKSVV